MKTRMDSSSAAADGAPAALPVALDVLQLPSEVSDVIWRLLPADTRLRCAEVSTGWRAALAPQRLWTTLDLSPSSGVAHPRTDALLRAAARRAGDSLRALDVSGTGDAFSSEALHAVLSHTGAALQEVRLQEDSAATTLAVLRAACAGGRLRVLELSHVRERYKLPLWPPLLQGVRANASTLAVLYVPQQLDVPIDDVEELVAAAPLLRDVQVTVCFTDQEAAQMCQRFFRLWRTPFAFTRMISLHLFRVLRLYGLDEVRHIMECCRHGASVGRST
jgi:hypothetical protein